MGKLKKFQIRQSLRKTLIISSIIFLLVLSGLLINYQFVKHSKSTERAFYNYDLTTNVNYDIYLTDNMLYDVKTITEGTPVVAMFIDYIDARYMFSYTGSNQTNLTGDYELVAEVRGYTENEDGKKIIWTKTFPVEQITSYDVTDKGYTINKNLKLDYKTYNKFATDFAVATGININSEVLISLKGNLNGTINDKNIKKDFAPGLIIPLKADYFDITKTGVINEQGDLKEKITTHIKPNIIITSIFSFFTLLSFIGVIFLNVFSIAIPNKTDKVKLASKILKNHGSRMVAIDEISSNELHTKYIVQNIEDLIKIADELEKPIFYKQSNNIENISRFYCIDNTSVYIYDIDKESKKMVYS